MTSSVCLAAQVDHPPRHCAGADLDGPLPLCRPCLDHATQAVPLLVHDYRDLEQIIPKPMSQWSDGQPRGSGEPPIPMQLHVEALQAEIWWLTTCWAEVLTDVHHLADPPRHVRRGFDVQWAVQLLTPRIEVLARVPAVPMLFYPHTADTLSAVTGGQGLLDLASAHDRARPMLGLTEPTYVLPGRCQAKGCGAAELRVADGSDTVWCDRCRAVMSRDDYDRLGNVFLREAAA